MNESPTCEELDSRLDNLAEGIRVAWITGVAYDKAKIEYERLFALRTRLYGYPV